MLKAGRRSSGTSQHEGMMKNLLLAFVALSCIGTAHGKSPLREDSYQPGVLTREGLALARICTSPACLYTLPVSMWRDEANAHDGNVDPLSAILFPPLGVVGGAFACGIEVCVGTVELLTFSQFKNQTYGWELLELTDKEVYLREERENMRRGAALSQMVIDEVKSEALDAAGAKVDHGVRKVLGVQD